MIKEQMREDSNAMLSNNNSRLVFQGIKQLKKRYAWTYKGHTLHANITLLHAASKLSAKPGSVVALSIGKE